MTASTSLQSATAISARQDRWIRTTSLLMTLAVTVASGLLSFSALSTLARESGIDAQLSFLFPIAVDGCIVAGSMVTMSAALRGVQSWYGIFVVVVGSVLSVFGNISGAGANPSVERIVAHGAPSLLLLLSLEASLHLTRKRLALSAIQAAEEAEAAAKQDAKEERARAAAEAREAKAEAARIAAEGAKARAAAKAAAVSTANAVLGRTKDSGRAQEIRDYSSTVEGWAELSIPKRVALIHSEFPGVPTGDILASETCVLVEGEDAKRTSRRVYKSVSELRLSGAEIAAMGPRRLAAV